MARPRKEQMEDGEENVQKIVSEPKVAEVLSQDCPWCEYDNNDIKQGPVHKKTEGKIALATDPSVFQCLTCGKNWNQEQLGKPWSLAMERGPQWEREHRARQLSGS